MNNRSQHRGTRKSSKSSTTKDKSNSTSSETISKYFTEKIPYQAPLKDVKDIKALSLNDSSDFKTPVPSKRVRKIVQPPPKKKLVIKRKDRLVQSRLEVVNFESEGLQLALALSRSLHDSKVKNEEDVSYEPPVYPSTQEVRANAKRTLEEYGFKSNRSGSNEEAITRALSEVPSRRKKRKFITPILFIRTDEDRKKLIAEKVNKFLSTNPVVKEKKITPLKIFSRKLKRYVCKSARVYNLNHLDISSLHCDIFYVHDLNLEHSVSKCGTFLKNWAEIPGRETTPPREISKDIKIKEIALGDERIFSEVTEESKLEKAEIFKTNMQTACLMDISPLDSIKASTLSFDNKENNFSYISGESNNNGTYLSNDNDSFILKNYTISVLKTSNESQDYLNSNESSFTLNSSSKTSSNSFRLNKEYSKFSQNTTQNMSKVEYIHDSIETPPECASLQLTPKSKEKNLPVCISPDLFDSDEEVGFSPTKRNYSQLLTQSDKGIYHFESFHEDEINFQIKKSPEQKLESPNFTLSRKSLSFNETNIVLDDNSPKICEDQFSSGILNLTHDDNSPKICKDQLSNETLNLIHDDNSPEICEDQFSSVVLPNYKSFDKSINNLNASIDLTESDEDDDNLDALKINENKLNPSEANFKRHESMTSINSTTSQDSIEISDEELNFSSLHATPKVKAKNKFVISSSESEDEESLIYSKKLKKLISFPLDSSRLICNKSNTSEKNYDYNSLKKTENTENTKFNLSKVVKNDVIKHPRVTELQKFAAVGNKLNRTLECQQNIVNSNEHVDEIIFETREADHQLPGPLVTESMCEKIRNNNDFINFTSPIKQTEESFLNKSPVINRRKQSYFNNEESSKMDNQEFTNNILSSPIYKQQSNPKVEDIDVTPDKNLIIKTSNVTPLCDYANMSSPEILLELRKYGIKNLKRHRAVTLLKYLYDSTHPSLNDAPFPKKRRRLDLNEDEHEKQESRNEHEKQESPDEKPIFEEDDQITSDESFEETYECISNIEIIGDLLNTKTDIVLEKHRSKKQSTCNLPLHIAWHNLLSANPKLHEDVLLYEPIKIEKIYQMLKEQGMRYEIKELIGFLDNKCVTIKIDRKSAKTNKELED